jgi:hypothetical protein
MRNVDSEVLRLIYSRQMIARRIERLYDRCNEESKIEKDVPLTIKSIWLQLNSDTLDTRSKSEYDKITSGIIKYNVRLDNFISRHPLYTILNRERIPNRI